MEIKIIVSKISRIPLPTGLSFYYHPVILGQNAEVGLCRRIADKFIIVAKYDLWTGESKVNKNYNWAFDWIVKVDQICLQCAVNIEKKGKKDVK